MARRRLAAEKHSATYGRNSIGTISTPMGRGQPIPVSPNDSVFRKAEFLPPAKPQTLGWWYLSFLTVFNALVLISSDLNLSFVRLLKMSSNCYSFMISKFTKKLYFSAAVGSEVRHSDAPPSSIPPSNSPAVENERHEVSKEPLNNRCPSLSSDRYLLFCIIFLLNFVRRLAISS